MSHTLLLIDDNPIQAATRQTILRRAGYVVIAVLNPERALDQLRRQNFPGDIDLVITDHIMPSLSGAEFVTQLRVFAPHLPVLVISGLAEAQGEYRDLNVDFRVKPLLPESLLSRVQALLELHGSATT
ncbi:MAG: two-component system response regulator [Acidobacteriota bacterium]